MRAKRALIFCLLFVVSLIFGCAGMEPSRKVPYKLSSQGTVIWEDEFEFAPPPPDWKLLRVEDAGGDVNFGFMRMDPGPYPSSTTFAYDEEPFGCSTRFEEREREFFKRFLFNAILQFQVS